MTSIYEIAAAPTPLAVKRIRTGIPAKAFPLLAFRLKLSEVQLARKLGVATRTITRFKSSNKLLPAAISEKVVRVARIIAKAKLLFTTDEAINEWLNTPAAALAGEKPIDLLDTDVGASDVEGLILGLAYGNFQ